MLRILMCTLALSLLTDIVIPSTVGTMCGPHCPSSHPFGIFAFVSSGVWWKQKYFYGESSLDLCAAALLRMLCYTCLLLLMQCCHTRRTGASSSPLQQPLNAELTPASSDAATVQVPAKPHRALTVGSVRLATALSFATLMHAISKAFTRMLQSGSVKVVEAV